jgi:hypothetical protein
MAIYEWILSGLGPWIFDKCFHSIKYLKNRERYIDEVIRNIDNSSERIYLWISTLESNENNKRVQHLQDSLKQKNGSKVEVKILVSSSSKSYKGSTEIYNCGIPFKYVPEDVGQALNFTLIDNKRTIITLKKKNEKSLNAIVLDNETINLTMAKLFNDTWNNHNSLPLYHFIFKRLNEINRYGMGSLQRIAESFNTPTLIIEKLNRKLPLVIIFFGRPGSGKSFLLSKMHAYLLNLKIANDEILTIDDYDILVNWANSAEFGGSFCHIPPDGFEVKDFEVLEKCNKEIISKISSNKRQIVLIELSRVEYCQFIKCVKTETHHNLLGFYTSADINSCLRRNAIRKYSLKMPTKYVPEEIISKYYSNDDIECVIEKHNCIHVVENNFDENKAIDTMLNILCNYFTA